MSKRIQEATQRALELINRGATEVWSAALGSYTKGDLFKISIELHKAGFVCQWIKNSNDNGLIVTKQK